MVLYDDDIFFGGYEELRRDPLNYNDMLEQPAVKELVGDPSGPLPGTRLMSVLSQRRLWARERRSIVCSDLPICGMIRTFSITRPAGFDSDYALFNPDVQARLWQKFPKE